MKRMNKLLFIGLTPSILILSSCNLGKFREITFDTDGGTSISSQIVLEGELISKPEDPEKEGYEFNNWKYSDSIWDFEKDTVLVDMTLNATWNAKNYSVTFSNWNGSVIYTMINQPYDTVITYEGDTPTRDHSKEHHEYVFKGWDKELIVKGNMEFIATFEDKFIPYIAKFYDLNDDLLYQTEVNEDKEDVYQGELPTKVDDENQYLFLNWEVVNQEDEIYSYKPVFASCTKGLVFDKGTVSIYEGSASKVVVPAKWNGYDITKIGDNAFKDANVTEVELPDSITTIGQYAFSGCGYLSDINMPDNLIQISIHAFENCSSLYDILFKDGLESIGFYAFSGCSSLISITIPNSVYNLGEYAFKNCGLLSDIRFENPESLDQYLKLETIQRETFSGCKRLMHITLPEGIKYIDVSAFANCISLSSITLPSTLEVIEMYSFMNTVSLNRISVGNNITHFNHLAFKYAGEYEDLIQLKEINYSGRKIEWNNVDLGDTSDSLPVNVGVVHCSDGDIYK